MNSVGLKTILLIHETGHSGRKLLILQWSSHWTSSRRLDIRQFDLCADLGAEQWWAPLGIASVLFDRWFGWQKQAAAAKDGRMEYGISRVFSIFAYASMWVVPSHAKPITYFRRYLYGQALGGLFFSPISESFGRKPLYIVAIFLDSGFCIIVSVIPHISAVVIGRFFSGVLSAIPTIVVAGSIEDMCGSTRRYGWFSHGV
jgi:hypothetical protein